MTIRKLGFLVVALLFSLGVHSEVTLGKASWVETDDTSLVRFRMTVSYPYALPETKTCSSTFIIPVASMSSADFMALLIDAKFNAKNVWVTFTPRTSAVACAQCTTRDSDACFASVSNVALQ